MNNILSSLSGLFGNPPQPKNNNEQNNNPAYWSYPKEAYTMANNPQQENQNAQQNSQSESNAMNIESLISALGSGGKSGGLPTLLLSALGKNGNAGALSSILGKPKTKKEEPSTATPNDEILL